MQLRFYSSKQCKRDAVERNEKARQKKRAYLHDDSD
jgi:hypothetical protein